MKYLNTFITILLLAVWAPAVTAAGFTSETQAYKKAGDREPRLLIEKPAAWKPADPKLPTVLIIGDSISIGYTRAVRAKLAGKANVWRPMCGKGPDNCGDTIIGLEKLDSWLGKQRWDVIHFNWGLWDLCYRDPKGGRQGGRDKVGGKLSVPPADYEKNLEQLVTRLKATGFPAKLFTKPADVHYTGEGYQKIAAQVAAGIEQVLPERDAP